MNINISHIAYGSMVNNIGAVTLGSSENVSSNGRNVNGTFIDEDRQLSRDYASVLWQYCRDTDRFMLTHVQGSAVEDKAMARFFSYRAASEVSRPEMIALDFPIAEVTDVMPRMEAFTAFKDFPVSYALRKHVPAAGQTAVQLSQLIFAALAQGKQLYVGMHTQGRNLRENGVFNTMEWYALIEAIGMFPTLNLRQQITFAFCVDENYLMQLADKAVVFYAKESKLTPPAGSIVTSYEQIAVTLAHPEIQRSLQEDSVLFNQLPEATAEQHPLSFTEFAQYIAHQQECRAEVLHKRPIDFTTEEYQMWRNMGHGVTELKMKNWQEAKQIFSLVGGAATPDGQQLRAINLPFMSQWPTQGMTLDQMKELVKLGIMDQAWVDSQADQVWAAEYKQCGKSEPLVIACVKRFVGRVPDGVISGSLALLNPEKDASLIESLLKLANDKKGSSTLRSVINEGLRQVADAQAKKLGINVEKWYSFLSKLSKTEPRAESEKFYMAQLQQYYAKERSQWVKALGTYAKNHTKNKEKFAFKMIEAYMKADKNGVQLPQRTVLAGAVEDDEPLDENQAEGMIWQWLDEMKRDKRSCLIKMLVAVVATAIVVGLLCWFLMGRGSSEPQQYATAVAPIVTSQHVMAQLARLNPEVNEAKVCYDTISPKTYNLNDMKVLSELDHRFTNAMLNKSADFFQSARFVTFRPDEKPIVRDTLLIDGAKPFLPQVLNRKVRVHQVLLPMASDTLCIDVPNSSVFDHLYPDSTHYDMTSRHYYFWFVAQVEDSLAAHHRTLQLAY